MKEPGPHTDRLLVARWLAAVVAVVVFGVAAYHGRPPPLTAALPVGDDAVGAAARPDPYYTPDMFDSAAADMAVAILTEPDYGEGGLTLRWPGPQVTYRVAGDYPGWYETVIDDAFVRAGGYTGLDVTRVAAGPADITVTRVAGQGAFVSVTHTSGTLTSATVDLGCCAVRPAYEDVFQAFGPLGDRGDGRSVFSDVSARTTPSAFDGWVLEALYAMPPGTPQDNARATLQALLAGR